MERLALRRGVSTTVTKLREEIRRFIESHHTHVAKPFRWTKSAQTIPNAVDRVSRAANRGVASRIGRNQKVKSQDDQEDRQPDQG